MNPYKQLSELDMFAIFGIAAPCFEAFKKIACAGCDGRVKTEQQDLLEAIDTVERIIKDSESDTIDVFLIKTDADIDRIMNRYIEVFGDNQRMTAARLLLEFVATNNVERLERCLTLLKKLV